MPTVSITTPYPDINALLERLLTGVRAALGEQFVGLYLYGSLASGDFTPRTSDIDFVVVTADALTKAQIAALEALHARLTASGLAWATKLEGAYVPRAGLRRHDPEGPPYPSTNEGRFYLSRLGTDWIIQRHILRECGVVVAGPPPHTLIDPVPPEALRSAVSGFLEGWWAPMLAHPARLNDPLYQAYAVLTLCRARYTLRSGEIISKPAAAHWAINTLGELWAALIRWALVSEPGDAGRFDETLAFLRDTLDYSQSMLRTER